VLFLDRKNQLIADEVMNQGTVDHAPSIRARSCAARWSCRRAPSSWCTTTPAATPRLQGRHPDDAAGGGRARALNLQVHDHLIVGRDGVASMKALGLF
jgi:DNA repair protein RadC